MTRKVLFSAILLLTILVISIPFTACSNASENSGYVLETLTKRNISFSFEYPAGYEKNALNPDVEESDESDVVGQNYIAKSNDNMSAKQISIQVWNPMVDFSDAKARLDYFTANIQTAGLDPEISEHSPLRIAGVDGEQLVYSLTIEGVTDIPNRLTCWVAAFDYRGQIWLISVATNMETTVEAKADFDHMVSTFKFL